MRRGSCSVRAMAVAATASGGETTAPSTRASGQPISFPTTRYATAPTTTVVKSTNPTESSAIGRMFARRFRYELSRAALNSSGGSTPNSTTSGSSSMFGIPGTNDRARPATTSTNGAGSLLRRATAAIATATTTNINANAPDM